jgi:DNA-binding beta-propeller fold protein YncE
MRFSRRRAVGLALLATLSALLTPAAVRAHQPAGQPDCNAPAKDVITELGVPGTPFEPVITSDGCWLFVTLASGNQGNGRIAVVRRSGGTLDVVRTVDVKGNPTGAVLTHDGKLLIVASTGYLAFIDAARLVSGDGDPVLGYMGNGSPVGFIYVNVTADDKILFAAAERAQGILVVNLERARSAGFADDAAIGKIDVGNAPISVTLSPDGQYLYTTSEAAIPDWHWPNDCRPEQPAAERGRGRGRAAAPPPYHGKGAIIVVDVARAIADPAHAVVSRVAAGCEPVRLVLSPDGTTAYVSARGDDELLAFDAHRLVSDTAHALLGRVGVDVAPVGVAVIDSGTRVVVTSSNRFAGNGGDHQPLTVVDAAKLRSGGSASVLGTLPAGGFPRELRVTADGRTLFVTNFTSKTLEMIDLARASVDRAR